MTADVSLPRAIRRRAVGQLGRAIDGLADARQPLADGIHDMRTSIKKVRALIALVHAHAPKKARRKARRADRRLRQLAATTSALRDAEVALHTWQALSAKNSSATPGASAALATAGTVRVRLKARLRAAERACEREQQVPALTAHLKGERRKVRAWVPRPDGEWDKLWRGPCVGLSKSYRRARRAMGRAAAAQSAEAFHDWRKAVKAHRYQLQFMQGVCPREMAFDITDLEGLGELLGDEHDLTMLREILVEQPELLPDPTARTRVAALIDGRRAELRVEALTVGERLFQERARLFRRRLQEQLHGESPVRSPEQKSSDHGAARGAPPVRGTSETEAAARATATGRAPFSSRW